MLPVNMETIEKFGKSVRRFWLTERIVVIETDGDMSHEEVDVWANTVTDTINHYPAERTAVFVLQDLSHPNQRITPYARQRAHSIYDHIQMKRPIYVASVLQNSILNQMASILTRIWDRPFAHMHQHVFTSRAAALAWLDEMLKKHG